jgi:thioredoxin-related protein
MLGLYLLGKIRFSHDSDLPYLGVGRLMLSIATFVFVLYLFTGLFGASLSWISSLIPPDDKPLSVSGYSGGDSSSRAELCGQAKYADKLHLPHGLPGYFDFEQGLACAKEQNKPLFVVFKGHACANCKKMENTVWADPENQKLLAEKFVIVGLYTDDRSKLPEKDQITSKLDGKVKNTIGSKNLDLLISKYKTNSIPFHVIIMPDGKEFMMGTTYSSKVFSDFLNKGL